MPNTRVKAGSAILAGIVAGTLYQLVQWGYITFQVGVARYNAIYGGFAALPLFLIWLEISWLIVLFGAEISFAHQNVHTYEFEPDCKRVSRSFKKLLSLRTLHMVVKRFQSSPEPLTTEDMLKELETPVRLLNQVLDDLVTCGLLHEVRTGDERRYGYQPAVNPDLLTMQSVLRTLERHGTDGVPLARTPVLADLERRLEQFDELVAQSEDNVLLKDI
jgi:membrane protein